MTGKPIFVVFMTRRDSIQCVHEPFGDAYYFGPERLAERYEDDEAARKESGFSESTFKTIMDTINRENHQEKRVLIKDMAQYLLPPNAKPVAIAPSLAHPRRGIGTDDSSQRRPEPARRNSLKTQTEVYDGIETPMDAPYDTYVEPGNPTVVPLDLLEQFHFAFLIRHPKAGIPSYYRCCIPPLDAMTGFYGFRSDEAGYAELRRLFDFLRSRSIIGPEMAGRKAMANGHTNGEQAPTRNHICVIDADDLLDHPAEIIEVFCKSVGIEYDPKMLNWDTQEEENYAAKAFEKWKGFHEDAIHSRDLKPRGHKRVKSVDEDYQDWVDKYGQEGANSIRKAVDENVEHYEYLKQFAIQV